MLEKVFYDSASGVFTVGETITGDDNGSTGVVVSDDGAGTLEVESVSGDWTTETTFQGDVSANTATATGYDPGVPEKTGSIIEDNGSRIWLIPDQPLTDGNILIGNINGYEITVDEYQDSQGLTFTVGETITGAITGATAVIMADDGSAEMTAYMTSPGVAFDGSERIENGSGVVAYMFDAATGPTIVEGDIVIWNLLHYQLTNAANLDGTDPATNTSAYELLEKAWENVGYITAWDVSEFDFTEEAIIYRQDLLGNIVFGSVGQPTFQWGNDSYTENILFKDAKIEQQNSFASFQKCLLYPESYISGNMLNAGVLFSSVIMFSGTNISDCNFGEDTRFNNSTIYQGASVSSVATGTGCAIENNILENGAVLTGITAGANCILSNNKIQNNARMSDIILGDNAEISANTLLPGAAVELSTINGGFTTNIVSGSFAENIIAAGAVFDTNRIDYNAVVFNVIFPLIRRSETMLC
ncbi:MAG: hypothetical protein IPN33_25640 [Saprospiraceae bacterium]|nr:hypothetical protein [Saprospiraceae bacterium]